MISNKFYFKTENLNSRCESKYENIEKDVNEIFPGLFLGNEKSSYDNLFLDKYKIKHIIRIMPEFNFDNMKNHIHYLHIPLKDSEICEENLNKMFNFVGNYLASAIKKNEPILVHCKRGHHRSASLIAAFMIKYLDVDFNTSLEYINKLRPCALRRDACIVQSLFSYYLNVTNNKCKNMTCIRNGTAINCFCN